MSIKHIKDWPICDVCKLVCTPHDGWDLIETKDGDICVHDRCIGELDPDLELANKEE